MSATEVKRFALSCFVCLALIAGEVVAADLTDAPPLSISIPAGDLASSLELLAKQTGIQFVYDANQLKGIKTQGVNGNLTPKAAVTKLLEGTNLTLTEHKSGAVLIAAPQRGVHGASSSALLPDEADNSAQVNQGTNSQSSAVGSNVSGTQENENKSGLEEIVVTAQKRSENLMDVPMSLTALSGDELAASQSYRFEDYIGKVPGLTLINTFGATGSQLVIRGITTGAVSINSSVANYLDETPYGVEGANAGSFLAAPNLDTFDMQRIEVLRGPQGTLYGANALAGLLKYVTNAPDPSGFAAAIETGANSVYNGGVGSDVHAMINVPLSSNTALRLVGFDNYYPGFIDDPSRGLTDINATRFTGGRGSLLFAPTDAFSLRVNALYQDRSYNDWSNEDVNPGTLTPVYGNLIQENLISQPGHTINQIYNVTMNWDVGFAKLLSTTSYELFQPHSLWDFSQDFDISPAMFGRPLGVAIQQARPANSWTEEFRVSSRTDVPLQWQIGGYLTGEASNEQSDLFPIDVATKTVLYNFSPNFGLFDVRTTYRENAGFGNIDYHITPTVDVSVGGRYSSNHQTFHQVSSGVFESNNNIFGVSSEDVFTYSGDVRWHVTPNNMLYARVATGFVPGGPNSVFPGSAGIIPSAYSPSTTVNYEAGIKSSLLENHVTVEVSAFDIEWKKIQLDETIGAFDGVANGGAARSDGVEWNFGYSPFRGLTLNLNGAYTNARLTQATPPGVGGESGDRLPAVPEWASSATAEYRRPVFGNCFGLIGVDWRFTGSRFAEFEPTTPRQELPSFNIVDFRTGLETDRWSATLYVKNVGNKIAINYVMDKTALDGLGEQSAAIYQPRTVGVTLSAKF
jgi:iron complex outermembrane recepter protein